MNLVRSISLLFAICLACGFTFAQSSAVNVRLVTDEADAVLAILAKRKANQSLDEADWQRSFEDADFKSFVLSDQLAERDQALEETLRKWQHADVSRAARLALAYLPKEARIKAKIYPVIKPRENTFVFDLENDPAIFFISIQR